MAQGSQAAFGTSVAAHPLTGKRAPKGQASETRPARILVADDDPIEREAAARSLRAENFQVTMAADGQQALALLAKSKFDVAILDVWMPRMNSLDVLKALRRRKSAPRVIVITSDATASTILKAVRERACRCMAKPVVPQDLIALVHEALARKSPAPDIKVVSARSEWIEILVPCTLEAASLIESVMISLDSDLPADTRSAIGHAFHELLLNAIEWGGRLNRRKKVRICRLRAKHMLLYRIADPGRGFEFSSLKHAAITHRAPIEHQEARARKHLRPGGFGLVLANANVDELLYNEQQNEVVFVKYLEAVPALSSAGK